jgi:hypothetical protein
MKKIILVIALFITINATAKDKTVTLTVTGQGKTVEEAKNIALRSAVEEAFGAFISSNTTILNDKLIKDEIVAVTNGNIQKYDILNETQLPDGSYAIIIKAIVSINKLTSYCQSKGVTVEYKGELFASNIALQELNKANELKAWNNTKNILNTLMNDAFDYTINAKQPVLLNGDKYSINLTLDVKTNNNYQIILATLQNFCKSISLDDESAKELTTVGKSFFSITFPKSIKKRASKDSDFFNLLNTEEFIFRNRNVANEILLIPWEMAKKATENIAVNNGIGVVSKVNPDVCVAEELKTSGFVICSKPTECEENRAWRRDEKHFKEKAMSMCFRLFGIHKLGTSYTGYHYEKYKYCDKLPIWYPKEVIESMKYDKTMGFNFSGITNFLSLDITDIKSIEEIKHITEYKIEKVRN